MIGDTFVSQRMILLYILLEGFTVLVFIRIDKVSLHGHFSLLIFILAFLLSYVSSWCKLTFMFIHILDNKCFDTVTTGVFIKDYSLKFLIMVVVLAYKSTISHLWDMGHDQNMVVKAEVKVLFFVCQANLSICGSEIWIDSWCWSMFGYAVQVSLTWQGLTAISYAEFSVVYLRMQFPFLWHANGINGPWLGFQKLDF